MAKDQKSRTTGEDPKLEMTPMIDVVFQLLIFFIVTLKQEDILSHLDVLRPAPDPNPPKIDVKPKPLLQIIVEKRGFVLQGKRVNLKELDRQLARLGKYDRNTSIIIKCTLDSPHAYLVQVLDVCAKAELKNLSVFSL